MRTRLASLALLLALPSWAACLDDSQTASGGEDLTSVDGIEHTIELDAFVDVPIFASDDAVKDAIHRELKSALGALRERGIGVADRDGQRNLAGAVLVRTPLDVIASDGTKVRRVDRVRYHYRDIALVEHDKLPGGPIDLTLLFGDYVARASELVPSCSDDPATEADSLWYHYAPGRSSCRTVIKAEDTAIATAQAQLADATTQISVRDADRRFVTTRATLVRSVAAPTLYPEYDRLWGFTGDTSRTKVVAYSFFGVDSDESNPYDNGLVEYLRFQRVLRARMPGAHVTETSPQAFVLDFTIDGHKLANVTWDSVERWIIDRTGLPVEVAGNAAKTAELLRQVQVAFSERWIVWQWPVTVRRGGVERTMTVEVRTFHGVEDGSADIRLHARWRYLEAFWHADIFAYTGHSHFGHGPLEPWEYMTSNFPNRYQIALFNSCLSFNYYDEDFLAMHPGGSKNLDVVVNGLPAFWSGMGEATGGYLTSLLGGERAWRDVLGAMVVNLPWQSGYDPMRAVNGELDNKYAPGGLTVAPR